MGRKVIFDDGSFLIPKDYWAGTDKLTTWEIVKDGKQTGIIVWYMANHEFIILQPKEPLSLSKLKYYQLILEECNKRRDELFKLYSK